MDSEECLKGGAELADGIDVRIARMDLGSEGLSFHLFGVPSRAKYTAIVNHHQQDSAIDRPIRIDDSALAQVLRSRFELVWNSAKPLESVLAERAIETAGPAAETADVVRRMTEVRAALGLRSKIYDRVLAHVAFRHGSSVVFIVGLPGAGKSFVRRRLASRLQAMGIEVGQLSDYTYAYRDFLHGRLLLQPARGTGFEPFDGGAFTVEKEAALVPALHSLAQSVRESMKERQVTVVEFARTDLVAAFQEFEELRHRCRIIYVEAPTSLRADRLSRRAEPPEITIDGQTLLLTVSDNHALPSTVNDELYRTDNVGRLAASRRWQDRMFHIDNGVDDEGARVNASLQSFVEAVLGSYRAEA
jgi:dephospho-CoA kinase